ncbi:uncharacterized protein LOC126894076 [Daktulosphaira vitifoliae]|uniref:uncharacterized protein LOC126894076 n=1 Tax=Daktulosphaira vitifoliae TaxID=58002 RepID=UPI0021AA4505|nr:uncharacterized protein LOC126894076 [Daktulosphaira vitifoliae]
MCFDYFILTETWLNNNINDCELGFDNYSVYRSDRNYAISNCNRGGGVAICVSNKFLSKIIDIPNNTIDQLFIAVTIVENGGQVDVIYTDLKKAFDTVDITILLCKLKLLGIHGPLLSWFESYLSNRRQQISKNS